MLDYSTKFFLRSSRLRINLLSYESKTTDKRGQYDWRTEKNLDGSYEPRVFLLDREGKRINGVKNEAFGLLLERGLLHDPSNFFHPSSRIALVYQSFCSQATADRLYYDWIAEKNLVEEVSSWKSMVDIGTYLSKLKRAGLTQQELIKVYKSQIRPVAEYSTTTWHIQCSPLSSQTTSSDNKTWLWSTSLDIKWARGKCVNTLVWILYPTG